MHASSQIFRIRFFPLLTSMALALSLWGAGCSSKTIDESNPDELYKEAEENIKDKRYLQAAERLRIVKNRFPYNAIATTAALRLADVAYLEEAFIEAAAAYETFRDLHPKHEKADYVIFRIGESYYNQLPGGVDRDLTPGAKAIEAYEELGKLYPRSEYIAIATEHSKTARERLAEKEQYIADYYFKRDMYDSAATRYEKIVKNFSGTAQEQRAYIRWADSLEHQEKDDEAKHVMETYRQHFKK